MLSVPFKRTDRTEIIKPASSFIAQEFGKDVVASMEGPLQNWHSMREQVRVSIHVCDRHLLRRALCHPRLVGMVRVHDLFSSQMRPMTGRASCRVPPYQTAVWSSPARSCVHCSPLFPSMLVAFRGPLWP